jgi:hypothetical protein
MRYSTSRHYEYRVQAHIPLTTLHLDCSHTIGYYGGPEQAEQIVRESGGTIAGNLSRCKECTGRYQAMVANIIERARREAGL